MEKPSIIVALSFALAISGSAVAQDTQATKADEGPSLKDQFYDIESDVATYDGFRMLKAYKVEEFYKAVNKTTEAKDNLLVDEQKKTADLAQKIEGLNKIIATKNDSVEEMEYAGSHINVLGVSFIKPVFIGAVGIITGALIATIIVMLFMTRNNQKQKIEIKKLYRDLFSEFEIYKHNAIEKHIKVSRELQDYRLRLEDRTSVK